MFALAGAETMCENLSVALKNEGHSVIAVSLYNYHSAITERLKDQGIKVVYLEKKNGADFTIYWKLWKLFRQEKPDVVHSHLYALKYVALPAKLAGVRKCVHTVHNIASKEATPTGQIINNFLFHFFRVIPIALSNEIQSTICTRYGLPKEKVPVVFNGINLDKCIPKEDYKVRDTLKFVHVGRFSAQKDHRMLIEAFCSFKQIIPNSKLFLVGTGELEEEVKRQVKELKLTDSVYFCGLQNSVFSTLHDNDVLLLSSQFEGMPMVLIEAMGTAMPIISTNVGGIPSMLENGKDAILTGVNADDFTQAMLSINNEKYRQFLGQNARRKAEEMFSASNMAKEYLEIYTK
jgi:glycosyltransferase involved in cell wall biosynthesis